MINLVNTLRLSHIENVNNYLKFFNKVTSIEPDREKVLPKLIDEEQVIEFDIKHFEDGIAKIEHEDKPKEKLQVLAQLKDNLNDSERSLNNQERELESFKWKIHK